MPEKIWPPLCVNSFAPVGFSYYPIPHAYKQMDGLQETCQRCLANLCSQCDRAYWRAGYKGRVYCSHCILELKEHGVDWRDDNARKTEAWKNIRHRYSGFTSEY